MLLVAVRAGLGISVILAIFGVVQTRLFMDAALSFAAAGIIPGTNIEIPPDVMLVLVAVALMAITTFIYRQYAIHRAALEAAMPDYVRGGAREGETWRQSVKPRLRRVVLAGRSIIYVARDLSYEFYFWVASLRQPVIAQTVSVQEGLATTLVKIDRWATDIRVREHLDALNYRARQRIRSGVKYWNSLAEKTIDYVGRQMLR